MQLVIYHAALAGWLGGVTVGRRTCDQEVVGSIPGRVAIK